MSTTRGPEGRFLDMQAGDLAGIDPRRTALLVVDMQYFDAHPDYGMGADAKQSAELWEKYYAPYFQRVAEFLPEMRELIDRARQVGCQIVFTAVQSQAVDGRDIGAMHRRFKLHASPNSREAEILDELAPRENDIVLTKTCGSIFNQGEIHKLFNNMGIESLVVCGVMTNYCVESAVRDACDHNYNVILAGNLCASISQEWHEFALKVIATSFAAVVGSDEVLHELTGDDLWKPTGVGAHA